MMICAGEITGNVSSVDRLWSLVPTLYTGVICCYHPSLRLLLMVMVAGVWSVRLTYNFWRRGGYSWPPWTGCEDYRFALDPKLPTHVRLFQMDLCKKMASSQHQDWVDIVQSCVYQLLPELSPAQPGSSCPCSGSC